MEGLRAALIIAQYKEALSRSELGITNPLQLSSLVNNSGTQLVNLSSPLGLALPVSVPIQAGQAPGRLTIPINSLSQTAIDLNAQSAAALAANNLNLNMNVLSHLDSPQRHHQQNQHQQAFNLQGVGLASTAKIFASVPGQNLQSSAAPLHFSGAATAEAIRNLRANAISSNVLASPSQL